MIHLIDQFGLVLSNTFENPFALPVALTLIGIAALVILFPERYEE